MQTRTIRDDGHRAEKVESGRREVVEVVGRAMADTYVLYFQTQSFHWNVRGPHFASLHALFETQYGQLAEAVDVLAERLRAMGAAAPTSLQQLASLSTMPLDHGAPAARAMLEILLEGHGHLARGTRDAADVAERSGDGVTHDLLIARATEHEKSAWMLRATLDE